MKELSQKHTSSQSNSGGIDTPNSKPTLSQANSMITMHYLAAIKPFQFSKASPVLSFTAQVRSKTTDTKASRPKALLAWLNHCTHLKIPKLGAHCPPLLPFLNPAPDRKPLPGRPCAWNKARPRRWGERHPGSGTPTAHTRRNHQLQSAGTSSIGKKEGRRQARPTSNSGNLRAGGHPEKNLLPRERRKKRRDASRPPGPGGSPELGPAPPPRPAPRLLSASGSQPRAGRPVTLMRSRHWDGVRS